MSSEDIIRDISVFFYYTFNDEEYAYQCSKKTTQKCLKKINSYKKKDGSISEAKVKSLVVYFTQIYFDKFAQGKKKKILKNYNPSWFIKDEIDHGLWKEFLQKTDVKNLKSLVWSKILNYTEEEIALGIGSSVGSVRFRVSKALRHIGDLKK